MMKRILARQQPLRPLRWGDLLILLFIVSVLYFGVHLAFKAPETIPGPQIVLKPGLLPYYAIRSLVRMAAAYILSLIFTIIYGYTAVYNRKAEQILMPLLDVLQSVPILSFLPVVLLSLSAILPEGLAAELASIVLIFTSQVWNLAFSWYQSLTTIPAELREASQIFRLNWWMRLRTLELPFATPSLIWNSMMSWAGGWFFLMAAEIFTVGERDFRLPGLGSYLQEAANQGDLSAILWGIGALITIVVLLDQFLWRPLVAWSERFTLEMVERDYPVTSWFYNLLHSSALMQRFSQIFATWGERVDAFMLRRWPANALQPSTRAQKPFKPLIWLIGAAFLGGIGYATWRAMGLLGRVSLTQWMQIGLGAATTLGRVVASLLITMAWTIPVGVTIGMNPRLSSWLQPLVQVIASVPATALFPVFILTLAKAPGGLNVAAILLMLTGTQWYVLFNVIAGASTIPQDLRYTSTLLRLSRWERWRTLILPALFPYLVTGGITASGGAWNASIVAEYVEFGGRTLRATGLGDLIAFATAQGDYALLLASTLTMMVGVVLLNRVFWRKLYRIAEERYRLE
jgi:NitT/TauT family transport system permease protein